MFRYVLAFITILLSISPCNAAYNIGSGSSSTILKGTTASIGGTSLAAGSCATGTATVVGSTTSMVVNVTPVTYPGNAIRWSGYVSSAGTITVVVCADVLATPTASVYTIRVIP